MLHAICAEVRRSVDRSGNGGWTLEQIRDEIKLTKQQMRGDKQIGITAQEFAEMSGDVYNTAYRNLTRGGVKRISDTPAVFDKLQSLEQLERTKVNRKKRAFAPEALAKAIAEHWLETGVPQQLNEICIHVGIPYGASTTRAAKRSVEQGFIYVVEVRGTEFYLPVGAYVIAPKKKPSLKDLIDTQQEAFRCIAKIYEERLVPPSIREIGQLMGGENTFPIHPIKMLIKHGFVREAMRGESKLYLPVGWEAGIKKAKAGKL